MPAMTSFTVHDLERRVQQRAEMRADGSYTRQLLDRGVEYCAKKLGEEAIETVLAAVAEDRGRLIAETADLIYHLLVLLNARGIALAEVEPGRRGSRKNCRATAAEQNQWSNAPTTAFPPTASSRARNGPRAARTRP